MTVRLTVRSLGEILRNDTFAMHLFNEIEKPGLMKIKILALVFVLGFVACGCNNDNNSEKQFESTAVISGFDMTLCGCCGGWVITIDRQDFDNRFSELPQNSDIDLQNAAFPITVQLNWSESDDYCGNGIVVEAIALVE